MWRPERRGRASGPRRGPCAAGDRGERERLAGERGERLGGDPDRRLRAGARVADGAAAACERAQVGERRARAVAAQAVRVAPGGDQPLDRPRGRLGVGGAAGLEREAAVGVLAAGEEARGAADRRRAAAPGGDERLERRAGVVDPELPPRPAKLKPPSAVAWRAIQRAPARTARSLRPSAPPRAARASRTRSCSRGRRTSRRGGAWRAARARGRAPPIRRAPGRRRAASRIVRSMSPRSQLRRGAAARR